MERTERIIVRSSNAGRPVMADGSREHLPEIRISVPLVQDFAYLAARMRPDEIEQYCAFTGADSYSPNAAATSYVMSAGLAYALVGRDGLPVAVGWFEQLRPGVWSTTGIGTMGGWAKHWRAITKESRRRMQALFDNGAHRIQIISLASRTAAHGWYERGLGMQCEGVLRGYAANGADAVIHAKTKEG